MSREPIAHFQIERLEILNVQGEVDTELLPSYGIVGELAIRHILPLSLTFDHRVADGAEACHFA